MINKKIILGILIIGLLSSCVQSTAFLGPMYTLGSTGNAFQAGLSYGSSKTVTSITGKTPVENIKDVLQPKDEDYDLRKLVKKQIKETRKKLNLSK
tara:strand:- start:399 stop:686 length:288 start_codon:yes stop_codon:yes gene_type:complete